MGHSYGRMPNSKTDKLIGQISYPSSINTTPVIWLVPDFGGQFCPIFGQAEEEFFLQPLDHDSMKRVLICSTYVYVSKTFDQFFFGLKLLSKNISINTFKKYLPTTWAYMRT